VSSARPARPARPITAQRRLTTNWPSSWLSAPLHRTSTDSTIGEPESTEHGAAPAYDESGTSRAARASPDSAAAVRDCWAAPSRSRVMSGRRYLSGARPGPLNRSEALGDVVHPVRGSPARFVVSRRERVLRVLVPTRPMCRVHVVIRPMCRVHVVIRPMCRVHVVIRTPVIPVSRPSGSGSTVADAPERNDASPNLLRRPRSHHGLLRRAPSLAAEHTSAHWYIQTTSR